MVTDIFQPPRAPPENTPASQLAAVAWSASGQRLYEEIQASKGVTTRLNQLATCWVEKFKKDQDVASVDIVNLCFACCGASNDHIADTDPMSEYGIEQWNELIYERLGSDLTERTHSAKWKYPVLVAKSRKIWKDWWGCVVVQLRSGNTYDYGAIRACISIMVLLSSARIQALRHTASAAAFDMALGLVEGAVEVQKREKTCERQLAAEKKKSEKSLKAKGLGQKLASLSDCRRMVQEFVISIFNGVFVLRFRDVQAVVREEAIDALGIWISKHPEMLYDDKYLKYFGWLLNDKHPPVRLAVIRGLRRIFRLEPYTTRFLPFAGRFWGRLRDMAHDKSQSVAVEVLKFLRELLMAGVLDHDENLASQEEIQALDCLVFAENRNRDTRIEALKFALSHFETFPADDDGGGGESRKKPSNPAEAVPALQLEELVGFLNESIQDEMEFLDPYVGHFVDAFLTLPQHVLLYEWGAIVALLLRDDDKPGRVTAKKTALVSQALDDRQTSILVRLLLGSAKYVSTSVDSEKKIKRSVSKGGKDSAKATPKALTDVAEDLSVQLLKSLPRLMTRFKANHDVSRVLLQLPCYLQPHVISMPQHRKNFDQLLRAIKTSGIMDAIEDDVIELAARALGSLHRQGGHGRSAEVDKLLQSICDHFKARILKAAPASSSPKKRRSKKSSDHDEHTLSRDEEFALGVTLKQFAGCCKHLNMLPFLDVPTVKVINGLRSIVQHRTSPAIVRTASEDLLTQSGTVLEGAACIAYSVVQWRSLGLKEMMSSENNKTDDASEKMDDQEEEEQEKKEDGSEDGGSVVLDQVVGGVEWDEEKELLAQELEYLTDILREIMGMHLDLASISDDSNPGDAEELPLSPEKLAAVQRTQQMAHSCIGDLWSSLPKRLDFYADGIDWKPSRVLLWLSANFFHTRDPRALIPKHEEFAEKGEDDDDDEVEKKDENGLSELERLHLLAPFETHLQYLLHNPHHRTRRQAAAILEYFADMQHDPFLTEDVDFYANQCHDLDIVNKQNYGSDKPIHPLSLYLDIQLTTLQVTFQNWVLDEDAAESRIFGFNRLRAQAEAFVAHLVKSSGRPTRGGSGGSEYAQASRDMLKFLKEGISYALDAKEGSPRDEKFEFLEEALTPYIEAEKGKTLLGPTPSAQLKAYKELEEFMHSKADDYGIHLTGNFVEALEAALEEVQGGGGGSRREAKRRPNKRRRGGQKEIDSASEDENEDEDEDIEEEEEEEPVQSANKRRRPLSRVSPQPGSSPSPTWSQRRQSSRQSSDSRLESVVEEDDVETEVAGVIEENEDPFPLSESFTSPSRTKHRKKSYGGSPLRASPSVLLHSRNDSQSDSSRSSRKRSTSSGGSGKKGGKLLTNNGGYSSDESDVSRTPKDHSFMLPESQDM